MNTYLKDQKSKIAQRFFFAFGLIMKIALVTTEYVTDANWDGGLSNYVHRVSLSLAQLGHQPVVFVLSTKNEKFSHEGIEIHRVSVPSNWIIAAFNIATFHRFSRFINFIRQSWHLNSRVKQIHGEQPFSIAHYTHLSGIGLFRKKKIPSIIRLSSYLPLWRSLGEYAGTSYFQTLQQEVVERWALKRADGIFGPSYNIAKYVQEDIKKKVDVIESPYFHENLELDTTLYNQLLKGKKYLLFMGRLSIAKGVLIIAEILKDLFKMFPYLNFVLIGKEQVKYQGKAIVDYIRDKAGEYKDRVIYPGRVPHSQLYPIIEYSQAVVLPSLIDNFPNVCLEAMALKQIVIGTKGTSFEQLIKDKTSGFLCEANDPQSLLEVISEVMNLPVEKKREIGENASKRISQLRPEKVVAGLVKYYDKIISKKTRGDTF